MTDLLNRLQCNVCKLSLTKVPYKVAAAGRLTNILAYKHAPWRRPINSIISNFPFSRTKISIFFWSSSLSWSSLPALTARQSQKIHESAAESSGTRCHGQIRRPGVGHGQIDRCPGWGRYSRPFALHGTLTKPPQCMSLQTFMLTK